MLVPDLIEYRVRLSPAGSMLSALAFQNALAMGGPGRAGGGFTHCERSDSTLVPGAAMSGLIRPVTAPPGIVTVPRLLNIATSSAPSEMVNAPAAPPAGVLKLAWANRGPGRRTR